MARWGKTDFRELKKFQQRLEKLNKLQIDEFCEAAAKELAARLLAKVIKRTPVADPSTWKKPVKGYVGGTLRRGWTAKTHEEAENGKGKGQNVKQFVESMTIAKKGDTYEIVVENVVRYSPYVEFGHRTPDHKGWIPGHFMMTISADELESAAPKIIEKKLMKFLKEVFG